MKIPEPSLTQKEKSGCDFGSNPPSIGMESNEDGIDIKRMQERAKEQGLISDEQTVNLRLLFSHGFSTAKGITEISGRGVGVTAAQFALQALGGDLSAEFTGPVNNNGRQPFRWLLRIAQERVLSLLPYESQHHKKAS